jgi:hypothetical protein
VTGSRYIEGGVGVAVVGSGSIGSLQADIWLSDSLETGTRDESALTGQVVPSTWAK